MLTPAATYDKQEVEKAIRTVEEKFPDDVERVRFSFHDDWDGDPALYFRILLKDRFDPKDIMKDYASRKAFWALCDAIKTEIRDNISADGQEVSFSFRTVSEQARFLDAEWD